MVAQGLMCVCVFHAPFSGVRIGARPSDGIHLVLTFEKLSLWPQLPVAPMGKSATADGVKRSGATIYVSRGSGHTGVVTLAVQRHLPL